MAPLQLLLLQIIVVVATARLLGAAFRKIRQPQVMGEIFAGILLGPTFLGWLAPRASAVLFPPQSLGTIELLSQIGILLFMFTVGLEVDFSQLRSMGRFIVLTSNVSILVPFALGATVAVWLYPALSNGSPALYLALFMGAAMSVTAFPVLARLLAEQNLLRTRIGSVALSCAAIDDVSAWCILAVIVALIHAKASVLQPWLSLAGLPAFLLLMLFVVRPVLHKVQGRWFPSQKISTERLAFIVLYILAASLITDWIGVHALFGAFLAGVIFPGKEALGDELTSHLKLVTSGLLLPLFFVISGLRTNLGLIRGWQPWLICGLLITIAICGKLVAAMLSARLGGMSWRDAAALGVLLNTRGLVELIILNVGYSLGVLSHTLFSMMVLMALVTTFMASPLLHWIYPTQHRPQAVHAA
jgi:Kef-type K+ transport system membrane component KefB